MTKVGEKMVQEKKEKTRGGYKKRRIREARLVETGTGDRHGSDCLDRHEISTRLRCTTLLILLHDNSTLQSTLQSTLRSR